LHPIPVTLLQATTSVTAYNKYTTDHSYPLNPLHLNYLVLPSLSDLEELGPRHINDPDRRDEHQTYAQMHPGIEPGYKAR